MTGVFIFLLSFLSFFQLGYHFWPDWSIVNGIRIDYLSPTLYSFDIIFLLLFLNNPGLIKIKKFRFWIILLVTLNIFISQSPFVSIYRWLRVFECYWLFNFLCLNQKYKSNFMLGLFMGVLITGVLAIGQFLKNSSLNGLWYWLGERSFNLNTPGISKILVFNTLKLRPYATFPHPNVLAGIFFLVSIFFFESKQKIYKLAGIFCWVIIALTLSRTIILLQVLFVLIVGFKTKNKYLFLLTPLIFLLFIVHPNSLDQRIFLIKDYLKEIMSSKLLGLGLGNSIVYNAKNFLQTQPIHNIYLLIISELGIIPFLFMFLKIFKKIKLWLNTGNYWKIIFSLTVLISGTFDHYWWTITQAQIVLSICLPFALKLGSDKSEDLYRWRS